MPMRGVERVQHNGQHAQGPLLQEPAPALPSPSQAITRALSTPLRANGAANGVNGAGSGSTVHIEGLEAGTFEYLMTTARAQRDLLKLLLQLMQVRAGCGPASPWAVAHHRLCHPRRAQLAGSVRLPVASAG